MRIKVAPVNIFSIRLMLLSAVLGTIASIAIGIGVYAQGSPNLNSYATVCMAQEKLQTIDCTEIAIMTKIDIGLSSYNQKIANSRLLLKITPEKFSLITDPVLLGLKNTYLTSAQKSFAVKEYGIVIAILVTLFSMGLVLPLLWLSGVMIWHVTSILSRQCICTNMKEQV